MTLSTEHGFPYWLAFGTIVRGRTLAEVGQREEGIAQMQQGLAALQTIGTEMARFSHLLWLAEVYGHVGRTEEGLAMLVEALAFVDKTGRREQEAELYRLKGELTLQKALNVPSSTLKVVKMTK